MKKILFVMNNLNCGGAEKALISLLETIDFSMYSVDLFLFKHEGIFLNNIPKKVNLLKVPDEYRYFDMPIRKATKSLIRKGRLITVIYRLLAGLVFKIEKNRSKCEQRVWKYISRTLKPIKKDYDVAIGFLEKNPIYFCIDKVNAKRKIGFVHNDYDKLGMSAKYDMKYFRNLNNLITVSEECSKVLKNRFPMYKEKIEIIYNIVSPNMIKKLADEKTIIMKSDISIVSVGRLNKQKGFDLAIEACKELVKDGYKINWYVVGEGEERIKLEKMIKDNNLQDVFLLLGLKENPYPFIREADIYVQPSRFEGKSIAIDEAKILNKPIIVTNFSTAKDQIKDNINGLIVEMNPIDLSRGIKELLNNKELRNRLVLNLKEEKLGTESEINKLYKLIY